MKLRSKFLITASIVFLAALVVSSGFAGGVSSFLATNSGLAPTPLVTVPGSVLPITGGATAQGTPASSTNVAFSIVLPLRNQATLKSLIQGAYTPKSANYRQFLTPAQVVSQFAPLQSDYVALENYLTTSGLQITFTATNNLIIGASGNLSAVAAALHTQFGLYSKAGTTFFTNTQPVQLPNTLGASAVLGLTNFSVVKPAYAVAKNLGAINGVTPSDLSNGFISGPFLPQQIQAAYQAGIVYSSGYTGTGVTIALVDAYDAPGALTDLANYDLVTGLPDAPSVSVITPTGAPVAGSGALTGWDLETSLDLQQSHALAPGANILLTLSYDAYDSLYAAVNYLVSQGPGFASAISQSWGSPEPFLTSQLETGLDQIYMLAAIEGISVFASTGDSGGANGFSFLNVQYPAASPYITAVGGTSAFYSPVSSISSSPPYSTGGGIIFQTAWSWNPFGGAGGWGTGGGQSAYFASPFYQTFTQGTEGAVNRTIPDISGIADPDTPVLTIVGPYIYAVGGTSVSSPEWAGIAALLDNIMATFGEHAPAGLLNPALYLGTHTYDYIDVTVGNNQGDFFSLGSNEPIGYNATTGYDLVTGFGTPNLSNLLNTLYAIDALPRIQASPAQAINNDTASTLVSGTGFTPSNSVNLTFTFLPNSSSVNTTASTNSTGGFAESVTFHSFGSGEWLITAQDNANSQIATTNFFLGPLITLTPSSAHEGTNVTINGYFFANNPITILVDLTPITHITLNASAGGSFTTSFIVPPQITSSAMVIATDGEGNEAQALLNISPFITVSPNNGSAGTHLTISGWSFDGTDSILVKFGATTIGYFGSDSNGDFSGAFNVPNVAPGLYTISATDSFGSVATTTFNVTGSAGTIAAALASSWLYLTTSGGSSQQFFTNSSGGAVNTLKVYLTGTGTVTISLGTSVLGTSIYSTSIAVSGAGWYNVTLPSTAHLAASSTYYLSVSPTSGATKWAFSNAWTYKLNAGLMYLYGGTGVTSAYTFLFIVS